MDSIITEIINYTDIWYQVTYTWDTEISSLHFVAYRINSMKEDNNGVETPCEISDSKTLDGYVKYDGCMNVQLEDGYAHFCGRYQSNQYGELFNKIYDKAKSIGLDD